MNISLRATFQKVLEHTQKPPKQRDAHQRLAMAQQHTFDNMNQLREMLAAFESLHKIEERWTPDSAQWKRAVGYLSIRTYRMALDKLEGLVVQRLFELAKMGLSGTGTSTILLLLT